MSRFEIKMPKLGESITEGTIIAWNVKAGDKIEEDDILLEVNTAKVSAEIPSPVSGTVIEILIAEGETAPVGTIIAIVDTGGESEGEEKSSTEAPVQENKDPEPQPQPAEKKKEKTEDKTPEKWYSPAVLRMAQEAQIATADLDRIPGTGYQGRVSKKDIERYVQSGKSTQQPVVTKETIRPESTAPAPSGKGAKLEVNTPVFEFPGGQDVVVKDMDPVRKLIADHMVMSKKTSPHVTTVVEADVTKLARWRDSVKEEFFKREGIKLTFMPMIAEATARALKDFPQVNASVDGYKMILKKNINLSIAVSLDNGNLVTPVIHHADKLNVDGLAASIHSLAAKARNNKLTTADIEGGTFTITNLGSNGSLFGMPIINQPQVAILGVGLVEKRPSVIETPEGDMIAIRHKVYLSLSYDHRIIDGALGGNFLRKIADYLENYEPQK